MSRPGRRSTGANIFFIKDGVIRTPTPDCFLNGITDRHGTRQTPQHPGDRTRDPAGELPGSSECFLTGSAAEVTQFPKSPVPLHAVDDLRNADERLHERSLFGGDRRRIRP
ncbi:aminotransferase class IV [Rhizobium leguminosarum]|uniref:aminotransferase class IV n=1 Tax=Rhizobium leguminosarum TaxID=384 RepID=UPI003F9442D3